MSYFVLGECGCPLISSDGSNNQAFKQWCTEFKNQIAQKNAIRDKDEERVAHTCIDYLKVQNV